MKILIVEDEPASRSLLESSIKKWGYEPVTAVSCEEGLETYTKESINFIICDWVMPGEMQGVDLISHIRNLSSRNVSGYTYMILLTSKKEQKDVCEGIRAGADDYLCKPFVPIELKTRIQLGRRILTLRDTNIGLNKKLVEMKENLSKDTITGLLNRQTFIQKLTNGIDEIKRNKKQICLLIVSVEKMNTITFTYSYKVAEGIGKEMASRLKSICLPHDIVGQFSSNEFGILTQVTNEKEGWSLLDTVKTKVLNIPFEFVNNLTAQVETKVGVAFSRPENLINADKLISQAFYNMSVYKP
jgi:diguanylate cyclase (GGDEF)-like protein